MKNIAILEESNSEEEDNSPKNTSPIKAFKNETGYFGQKDFDNNRKSPKKEDEDEDKLSEIMNESRCADGPDMIEFDNDQIKPRDSVKRKQFNL